MHAVDMAILMDALARRNGGMMLEMTSVTCGSRCAYTCAMNHDVLTASIDGVEYGRLTEERPGTRDSAWLSDGGERISARDNPLGWLAQQAAQRYIASAPRVNWFFGPE